MYQSLHDIGLKYGTDKATAHHYLGFYEEMLHEFEPKNILEIGVFNGASLRMWKHYFPSSNVFGIDINPAIKIDGCTVLQLDATDIYAMRHTFRNMDFDLIIDDGSHYTRDQQIAFFYLYNYHLSNPGFYIIEDVHTSFIRHFTNTRFTTYELLTSKYTYFEYWDKPTRTDSGTIIIKKAK